MGLICTNIILSNPIESNLTPIANNALVDKGSNFLCIPEHLAIQLNFKNVRRTRGYYCRWKQKK